MNEENTPDPPSRVLGTWATLGAALTEVTMLPNWNPKSLTSGTIGRFGNVNIQFEARPLAETSSAHFGLGEPRDLYVDPDGIPSKFLSWDGDYEGHPLTIVGPVSTSDDATAADATLTADLRPEVLTGWVTLGTVLRQATSQATWDEDAFTTAHIWRDGDVSVLVDGDCLAAGIAERAGLSAPPHSHDGTGAAGGHFTTWQGDHAGHNLRVTGWDENTFVAATVCDQGDTAQTPAQVVQEQQMHRDVDQDVDQLD